MPDKILRVTACRRLDAISLVIDGRGEFPRVFGTLLVRGVTGTCGAEVSRKKITIEKHPEANWDRFSRELGEFLRDHLGNVEIEEVRGAVYPTAPHRRLVYPLAQPGGETAGSQPPRRPQATREL